jgi:sec-independent protein translocase protein TatA
MGPLGWPEIILIFLVLLLLFGAKRLPEMGRSMGKGMREFKDAVSGIGDDAPSASSTQPASPGELPAAPSDPSAMSVQADPDEKERETVS